MQQRILTCGNKTLDITRPQVMGILNVTPDSFSDGGRFFSRSAALEQAARMVLEGAAIIDVGGESTRPGAVPVSEQEELDRVIPVVELLRNELDVVISVDSSTPIVFREAALAGAGLINDVRALQRDGALEVAASSGLPVCLMHMQGQPETMQHDPDYRDVVEDVIRFLRQRINDCCAAGIPCSQLLVDPGFGFGKSLEHNLRLMNQLERLAILDVPLLVGVSRKSMIGTVLNRPVGQRLFGSVALAVLAVQKGARIIRAHDVAATVDAIRMTQSVMEESFDQEATII